ncbi:MAG: response regulator [Dehalococcoidales bacterium]|nr:response regulator [Dehalococcoidales bacterium]
MTEGKATILVVDDEENVRALLQRILDGAGYDTITATNGREALGKLSLTSISLVLLDVRMPELDGFQTLKLIRKQYNIPVIMVTGVGEVTSVSDALTIGADDYVKKPFQSRELLARIEAKLRRAKSKG